MSAVTVVIPTFNRAGVLKKALDAYSSQSTRELIRELIVVDDGSTDDTRSVVEEASRKCSFEVRYVRQPNSGPATARNAGIREARSEIILFTDSDIVPDRELVSQHVRWHQENPADSVAVLGYVTWPQEPRPTPFMKWLGEYGALFAYHRLRKQREISYQYMYTCNLSFKASFLRENGQFDEEFKNAAWEDVELGFRLHHAGLCLLYNREAVAYHYQFFSFADVRQKAQTSLAAKRIFARTPAGKEFEKQQRKKYAGFRYRLAKIASLVVGAVVRPANALLDSHIPLPASLYRALYWYHVSRLADVPAGQTTIAQSVVMDVQK